MASSNIRLSVIIPAYNEALRLPETLGHAIAYLKKQTFRSEIIVVNDGSTDDTETVVRNQDVAPVELELMRHPDGSNHGKGASVKLGVLAARGAFCLLMDADNSTALNQIESFWPYFDQGYEIVIGSRAIEGSVIDRHQTKIKEIAGRIGNWFVQTLAVPGISDTQAGFKMFTGKAAESVFSRLTIDKWGYDIELLVIARTLGFRIREVPITWQNVSGSKVTVKTYFEVIHEICQIRRNLRAGIYR